MEIATAALDVEAVFTALDRKRRHARMGRKDVAAILGVSPPAYTMWGQGSGMSADVALRACLWLEADIRGFVRPEPAGRP